MSNLPVVCVFGTNQNLELKSSEAPHFETRDMDCRCYADDSNLMAILAKEMPVSIASVGNLNDFKNLNTAPFDIRKMWVHFNTIEELKNKSDGVFQCFLHGVVDKRNEFPLISIFTPTYKTGAMIERPWMSLKSQIYNNWEWILMDDSDDNGKTFEMLSKLAEEDCRVKVYRERRHSGKIGSVKKSACGLARGSILVELDHDDELTPDALLLVEKAFSQTKEAGFVYTDCAECFEDGGAVVYPEGWGLGYGSYHDETHGGMNYKVINSPNINPKTIRHIVAAPNHIRAWRKDFYDSIGGHNDLLHVADDYDLMVKTFLKTRMCRIPKMCYIQYRNEGGNTTFVRNQDIQRMVRYLSMAYDDQIHARFEELDIDDYVWKQGETFWRLNSISNPPVEQHCTLIFQ